MENRLKVITVAMMISWMILAVPLIAYDLIQNWDVSNTNTLEKSATGRISGQGVKINRFTISAETLSAGQPARINWDVSGATYVFLTNQEDLDNAEVGPSGYLDITPLKKTDYILTAYDQGMMYRASALATIDVLGEPPAPQAYLNADPINILAGDKVKLSWKTLFAHTVSIDNGIGMVGAYGAIEISPATTTTYTLAATGLGGSNIANITITVLASQAKGDTF